MLIMGACASYLALLKHQPNNFFGGLLTFYMITTAWLAGRRSNNAPGTFDWAAMLMGFVVGASVLTLGIRVAAGLTKGQPGVPIGVYFFLASISILAASGDVRLLIRGGLSGSSANSKCFRWHMRHKWRTRRGLPFNKLDADKPVNQQGERQDRQWIEKILLADCFGLFIATGSFTSGSGWP